MLDRSDWVMDLSKDQVFPPFLTKSKAVNANSSLPNLDGHRFMKPDPTEHFEWE
jgi:hypothetical protein